MRMSGAEEKGRENQVSEEKQVHVSSLLASTDGRRCI